MYCNELVCLSVCPFAYHRNHNPFNTKLSMHVTSDRSWFFSGCVGIRSISGLCSYRVRGVEGSRAKQFTIELYSIRSLCC